MAGTLSYCRWWLCRGKGMTKDEQSVAVEGRNKPMIMLIRGHQVMLSMDLARVHRIKAEVLAQTIERNIEQFPADSMFRLTPEEIAAMKLPAAASNQATVYAFTAEGVVILSGILFDERERYEDPEKRPRACRCPK
ncbi:MAG TPA: ORF6N domain-containing protein [Gallionella sp.]|nr:ORF6N domain-containing protein [Gallionella sp.]